MNKDIDMENIDVKNSAVQGEDGIETASADTNGVQIPADYDTYSSLAKLAIQNSLMLMAGKYGGGFFINYVQDEGTAYGWYNFTIVYPDGSHKTLQLYKNHFTVTDVDHGNGVWVPAPKSEYKKGRGYTYVDWDGPPNAENFSSMAAYETPQMLIPAKSIWRKILENSEKIPIVKISNTANIEQLLAEIQAWAEEESMEYGKGFVNTAKECYITKEAFQEIVEQNGWNFSRAKTEFDTLGLFVKDNTTKGYQKSKRIGSETKRFYVIRKDILKAADPPKLLGDVTFNWSYKTDEEKKIEQLREERDKYIRMFNELSDRAGFDDVIV